MAAPDARRLIGRAARADWLARQTLAWRCAQLDPAVGPGMLVTVPGHPGRWRIGDWDMRQGGIEMTLTRAGSVFADDAPVADPGSAVPPSDAIAGPTVVVAFELPWDGLASSATPALYAAVSSATAAWQGAALFADPGDGTLVPLGSSGRARSIIGTAEGALQAATPHLVDRTNALVVELVDPAMDLAPASLAQCLQGANRALVGEELIQFAEAEPLGSGRWRLRGLMRGRGGTEAAIPGHGAGERFVLLDGAAVALNAATVGDSPIAAVVAIGAQDPEPPSSPVVLAGMTRRPLPPVHGTCKRAADGSITLAWTRRSRGAWLWPDGIDTPLNEQSESYLVRYMTATGGALAWQAYSPLLLLDSSTAAALAGDGWFEIAQQGDWGLSPSLRIDLD
jgi:hypothetical protein